MPRWLEAGSDVPAALRDALRETAEWGPDLTQLERLIADSARCAGASIPRRSGRLPLALAVPCLLVVAAAVPASAGRSSIQPALFTPEVQLLLEARRALPDSPASTARLLRQHRQTFADGDYVEEREALQIETLWRLGHRARARASYGKFSREFPHSPYIDKLEGVLRDDLEM